MGLIFAVALAITFLPIFSSVAQGCTAGAPYTEQQIQNCLDQGGTTTLLNGQTYTVTHTITMRANVTLTDGGSGALPILQATPNLTPANGGLMLRAENVDGFTIRNVIFDGNKANRSTSDCGNEYYGWDLLLYGNNFHVMNVTAKNAICGSNAQVQGSGFEITYSTFADGGYPATVHTRNQLSGGPWADGLTVGACNGGYINHNKFSNNTDVDLIIGGGSNCTIELNNIWNNSVHAFAGLNVGWFPGGAGDHGGSTFRHNCIVSGTIGNPDDFTNGCASYSVVQDKLAFGLIAGNEPWIYAGMASPEPDYRAFVWNAGAITDNTVIGAVVNLSIEGIAGGNVQNNHLFASQGSFGFACTVSQQYTAHFFSGATINAGWDSGIWEPFWFYKGCGTWNLDRYQPGDPNVIAHYRYLLPGQQIDSPANVYHLAYQTDGNFVLYNQSWVAVWWQPPGPHPNPTQAIMQDDANFVTYASDGPVWWTHWSDPDNAGAYLAIDDFGGIVEYSLDGTVLWSRF